MPTPPCLEVVTWLVMAEPVSLSADQLRAFTSLIPGTNRPVQPRYDREIRMRVATGEGRPG